MQKVHKLAAAFAAAVRSAVLASAEKFAGRAMTATPGEAGYTGVADTHWRAHARGNGSARVRRAALKRRNQQRNRRAHRG